MTRVFFWSADKGSTGCAYYRCMLPAEGLRNRGHEVVVSNNLMDGHIDSDVVVGQRVSLPGPSKGWQALAATGRYRMVYEVDDDLLDIDPSNERAWSFFSQPEIQANIIRNIQVSDLVTVSTNPLAEVLSKHNSNVAVLPNCIPAALLDAPKATGRKGVVIGWSGGASHELDIAEVGREVTRFAQRRPDVSLHIMGDATAARQLARSMAQRARFTSWVESVPEFHAAIDFDITLAPLRPSPFNRSKSAIRCLEAAALGIPVVASDFGPYAEFVQDGITGLLASRPHMWGTHLRTLLDPWTRKEMGAAARKLAASHTIEGNIELWEKALS